MDPEKIGSGTPEQYAEQLAQILEAILGEVQRITAGLDAVTKAHQDLDREIHEDFFDPIRNRFKEQQRTSGIESIRGKYGSMFDPITENLKAFGIDDIYAKIFDAIEELRKGDGWKDEQEEPWVKDLFSQAQERIKRASGIKDEPPAPEKLSEEKPAASVAVEIKKTRPRGPSPMMDM